MYNVYKTNLKNYLTYLFLENISLIVNTKIIT